MSADQSHDDKSEEATEKKLSDVRGRGDVPISREVGLCASLLALLCFLLFMVRPRAGEIAPALFKLLDNAGGWRLERGEDALALVREATLICAAFLGPPIVLFMLAGIVATVSQAPPQIAPERIAPNFARLSPAKGLSRILGRRGLTEFAKGILKIAGVGAVAGFVLAGKLGLLVTSVSTDVAVLPERLLSICTAIVASVAAATLAIAAADLAWTRILWRQDQRMTKQEVKEELRQLEGDRMVKARLRSLRLDRSRKRMFAAVPRATMVVVNPTHYAVALRYVRSEGGAPMVLAKGVDLVALRIRQVAMDHSIPIVEDKPLARSLHAAVDVDRPIPPEFYKAVAEIVHLVSERRSTWPIQRNRATR